ncbi:MAG: ERF family protein, partial [Gammaproteobacteria bacterium]|nr:ERF family protein [Gammaproteobacteria bacterium]
GKNKFQNYSFTKHDDVTRLVRAQLVEHGVVAIPRLTKHSKEEHKQKDGVAILTTVDVEVDFVNIDDPKDLFTVPGFAYGIDKNDLGPGKAISYAVKNVYLKTFALETGEKDSEETADDKNTPQKQEQPQQEDDPEQVELFNKIGNAMKGAQDQQDLQNIWMDFEEYKKSLPERAQTQLNAYRQKRHAELQGV